MSPVLTEEQRLQFAEMSYQGASPEQLAERFCLDLKQIKTCQSSKWYKHKLQILEHAVEAKLLVMSVPALANWEEERQARINEMRATHKTLIKALKDLSARIAVGVLTLEPGDLARLSTAHSQLVATLRDELNVSREEKLAVARASAEADKRLTEEEIACLNEAQLLILSQHGMAEFRRSKLTIMPAANG